ncbi:sugar phosphate isomerase/epimerase family protein [Thermodesulfobacteriota bacterium]
MLPKIALCNILEDLEELKEFALEFGFLGIDWSFDLDKLPETPTQESLWAKDQEKLTPLEVRYHCPFNRIDIGSDDPKQVREAREIFRRIIMLISKAGGKFLTIHIGLGHNSTEPLSWDTTIANLRNLAQFGAKHGVRICLENLAWGWTSKPNLFEKLVRQSGSGVTLDIGHAFVSESILTQQYNIEDFVTPHADRVFNTHIYHSEIEGKGHLPPSDIKEIKDRLALIKGIGCPWWAIEIKEKSQLLRTKEIIDEFLSKNSNPEN